MRLRIKKEHTRTQPTKNTHAMIGWYESACMFMMLVHPSMVIVWKMVIKAFITLSNVVRP